MKQRSESRQLGMSLAEVLVAVAIFAVIFIAALLVYDRSNKTFKDSVQSGDMQQNTRVAFETLVGDVRMAGFDYDRDGLPSGTGKHQQPDEQLEYVGPSALTLRGNFDYETDGTNENGREAAYQPGGGQFPIVTTGNDEIVTYALKSINGSNPDSIVFYADTKKPRETYPGGTDEQTVTIPGVDLCTGGCKNPPYRLYRITLKDQTLTNPSAATDFIWAPVADNVRRVQFTYYSDTTATTTVTPNLGVGAFKTTGTPQADLDARALRGTIQAVRIDLVGMDASATAKYVSPIEKALPDAEEVASAVSFRQYQLASVVMPRNINRRGIEEFDTEAPGAPTVTGACTVGCGVVSVSWSAPSTGTVDGYSIIYDTNAGGSFGSVPVQVGSGLTGYVANLDPTKTYYFKVVASNSFGSQRSTNTSAGIQPINPTKPEPPSSVLASGGPSGSPAALPNKIEVRFNAPKNNVSFGGSPPTACGGPMGTILSLQETTRYSVHRATSAGFTPSVANRIFTGTLAAAGAPVVDGSGNAVFTDTTPKLNCTPYHYIIRAEESCSTAANLNTASDVNQAVSDYSASAQGQSSAPYPPAAPTGLAVTVGSCATNPCVITLGWPKVTLDTGDSGVTPPVAPSSIQVPLYTVERTTYVNNVLVAGSEKTFDVTDDPANGLSVSLTDSTAPQPPTGTVYSYTVVAKQCNGTSVSVKSTAVKYPCGQITISPPIVLDGSGTPASPWLITAPTGVFTASTSAQIKTLTVQLLNSVAGTTQNLTPTIAGSKLSATVDVPLGADDGATYELRFTYVDMQDCVTVSSVYMQDSPTGCCMAPWKEPDGTTNFDATVLRQLVAADGFNSGNYPVANSLVLKLRNMCDDNLTLTGLELEYEYDQIPGLPAGCKTNKDECTPRKLMTITYPNTSGGTTIASGTGGNGFPGTTLDTNANIVISSFPANTKTAITGLSTTHQIVLVFNVPVTPADLVRFCAKYDRTGQVGNTACKIVKSPSTNGTCQ